MIGAIVAIDKNFGIGKNGQMPWPRLTEDMRWFRQITDGNVVLMGSATWRSIGKPLPNRINIVMSATHDYTNDGAHHCFSEMYLAIAFAQTEYPDMDIMIIGGQSIYDQTMDLVDTFFITEIDHNFECDRFFNMSYVKERVKQKQTCGQTLEPFKFTLNKYTL